MGLCLVTGATGNVGRHIVNELLEKGYRVRALTRNPEKANLPIEAEVVQGDLARPEILHTILEGVTSVHLITTDGASGKPLQSAPEIVKQMVQAGVKKSTVMWSGQQGPVEQAVKESSIEWTILQPQEFMSNMLAWVDSIRENGIYEDGFGSRKTALIHEGDIARVVAAVLTEDGHAGREYTLTGPKTHSIAELVRIIGDVIDRDIQFHELSEKEIRNRMKNEWGSDESEIDYVLSWYKNTPAEGYTVVPTVEEITGRPARTFRQWAEEHRHLFQ